MARHPNNYIIATPWINPPSVGDLVIDADGYAGIVTAVEGTTAVPSVVVFLSNGLIVGRPQSAFWLARLPKSAAACNFAKILKPPPAKA